MKERISATIDEKTRKELDSIMKKNKYRNMSHLVEEAIKLIIEKERKER